MPRAGRRGCARGWRATRRSSPTRATSCAGRCVRRGWGCTGSTISSGRRRSTWSSGGPLWRWTTWSPRAGGAVLGRGRSWSTWARCSTTGWRRGVRWRPPSGWCCGSSRCAAGRWSAPTRCGWRRRARNLVANAVEHGGSPVRVRGRVVAGRVRVEVSDAGPGLPGPVTELVGRRRGAGRGRGLGIAARIAESYGGRVSAAPSAVGARLVLELPSADAAPAVEPFQVWPPEPTRADRPPRGPDLLRPDPSRSGPDAGGRDPFPFGPLPPRPRPRGR